MAQDLSKLAPWQEGAYNDRVTLYQVTRPKAGTGEPLDEVISKVAEGVWGQFLYTEGAESPSDTGRQDRRINTFNTTADQECGSMWYIRDTTPERLASDRFVFRVQDTPTVYPTTGVFNMNMKQTRIMLVEHPPPETLV